MNIKGIKNMMAVAMMGVATLCFTACADDATIIGGSLHPDNPNPQQTTTADYDGILNKIYGNLALTGLTGPHGNSDLPSDIDEGMSVFMRVVWYANELSSDESLCAWLTDAGIPEFNRGTWGDNHALLRGIYYRCMFGITLCNFFLDNAPSDIDEYSLKVAEVRFMRALYYYYLMDMFGNPPFITHVSSEAPVQASRKEVFDFVESELKDVIGEGEGTDVLAAAKTIKYGRADIAAGYMLLMRMYLNAEVYTGTARWEDARAYAEKAINSGYSLSTTSMNGYNGYQLLFMGDNDTNGAQNEIVFPILFDGELTQSWGGVFLAAGCVNADDIAAYPTGISSNWGGIRAKKYFIEKWFPNDDAPSGTPADLAAAANDDRCLFMTQGHELEINAEDKFEEGYGYVKFLNTHADGSETHNAEHTDYDFPLFRLAEAYLTYAEADARLNGGNVSSTGLEYIKALRNRAHANSNINVFSLDDIEDEWSREFGFEGRRRMDMIRFGNFTGVRRIWIGGTAAGGTLSGYRSIFPLPSSDLVANPNLKQNEGY
ncbi:MAG: RagB/SusD family nutrient uptake outer membrane protein [Prevotella sp.]|nr:RagB/SusD family nutrient uptake outer membrane protein [Prevotella sp.]